MHGRLRLISLVRWDVGFVEILASTASWWIATSAAVATAFQTLAAFAAAGEAAAGAPNDAPGDREDDEPADDDYRNHRPPERNG